MNYSDREKQNLARKLVDEHVYCNVGTEVEYILRQDSCDAPYCWDDVDNQDYECCPECDSEVITLTDKETYICSFCDNEFAVEEVSKRVNDIYEWWKVSSCLLSAIKSKGHPCIEEYNIWGRCCTGQAICIDSYMQEIAIRWYGGKND